MIICASLFYKIKEGKKEKKAFKTVRNDIEFCIKQGNNHAPDPWGNYHGELLYYHKFQDYLSDANREKICSHFGKKYFVYSKHRKFVIRKTKKIFWITLWKEKIGKELIGIWIYQKKQIK